MKTQKLLIERLESRNAPAVLFHFTDLDGDRVTMNISKGTSADLGPNFTFSDPSPLNPRYIREIDLAGGANPQVFAGANITISVARGPTGDGFSYVGWINAQGIDLGNVTIHGDLGKIVCGDGVSKTDALSSLNVQSLGRFGMNTGALNLDSTIDGRLGSLMVKGDAQGVFVHVTDTGGKHRASIGSVRVGGSLRSSAFASFAEIESDDDIGSLRIGRDVGGGSGNDGFIYSKGHLGSVTIGGSLLGGTSASSGRILSGHDIGPVKIGGDVIGGSAQFTGQIAAGDAGAAGSIASVAIGGSLVGGGGSDSGEIHAPTDIGPVRIGGSLVGGAASHSGEIFSGSNMGLLKIGGNITGGDGFHSGEVDSARSLKGVMVGGSIFGGKGFDSGQIYASDGIGPVKIAGDVAGSDTSSTGLFSAQIATGGVLTNVNIGGSLLGGAADNSGTIFATGGIGVISIAHDTDGGFGNQSGSITSSAGKIGSVFIGGSMRNRLAAGSTVQSDGGIGTIQVVGDIFGGNAVATNGEIGSITVNGSIGRDSAPEVLIFAQGRINPASPAEAVAIGKITVGGSVTKTRIEAGYDTAGNAVNADASIGSVRIGGDWIASDLIAGIKDGGDGYFGNVGLAIDDTVIPGGNPAILAKIGSITIGGQVIGTPSFNGDSHAFAAEVIGSMRIGGTTVTLPGPHNNFNFTDPSLSDVTVEEL